MMLEAVIIADIGGTSMRIGHVSSAEAVDDMAVVSSDVLRVPDPVAALSLHLGGYAAARGIRPTSVVLGVPFSPDPSFDTAVSSPNIPSFEGVPVRSGLTRALGVPVYLERDITLLLLGEWAAGAARGAPAVLGMFVGTGVGGAVLHDGVPYRGATGSAVELGHIPIRAEGRRCVCGNVDCLEAYACGHVLREIATDAGIPIAEIFERGPAQPGVARALAEFVRDLAYALATAVNLFHPDLALVGGGIPEMRGFPRARFGEIFAAHLRRPAPADSVVLRWAELGSRAALYGARIVVASAGTPGGGHLTTSHGRNPTAGGGTAAGGGPTARKETA